MKYIDLPTNPSLLPSVIDNKFKDALIFKLQLSITFSTSSIFYKQVLEDGSFSKFISDDFFINNSDALLSYRKCGDKNISSSLLKIKKSGFYFSEFSFCIDRNNDKIHFRLMGHMNLDVSVEFILKSFKQSLKYVGDKPLKDFSYSNEVITYSNAPLESHSPKYKALIGKSDLKKIIIKTMFVKIKFCNISSISNSIDEIELNLFDSKAS